MVYMTVSASNSIDTIIREMLVRASEEEGATSVSGVSALANRYVRELYERVRYIHLPHIPIPREIIDLFVELYAFRSVRRWLLDSECELSSDISVSELLRQNRHLLILGEPGAGKTTFVRRVAYSLCSQDAPAYISLDEELFPILIECRHSEIPSAFRTFDERQKIYEARLKQLRELGKSSDHADQKRLKPPPDPLIIFAANELIALDFPHAEQFLAKVMQDGRVIVFVDGLDEAPAKYRRRIIKSLEIIRARFPAARIIVTCRAAEAESTPAGFAQYEIAPLNPVQRELFARKWFASEEQAVDFLAKVSKTHIWDVTDRPLLLTLLCALYQSGGDLPRFKVDLYKECAELALRRWDAYRRIRRETAFDFLSLNQRLTILAKVAAQLTLEGKTQVDANRLDSWFGSAMEESGVEGDPTELREEMVSHTGLLVQVALGKFSFSHKSLQEYFAALHFASASPMLPFQRLRYDRQWLLTAEMTAAISSDAGKLFISLFQTHPTAAQLAHDISIATRILFESPVTILAASREQLIQKLVIYVQNMGKDLMHVVPVFHRRLGRFDPKIYSQTESRLLSMADYDLSVYLYGRRVHDLTDDELQVIGLAGAFLLKLLIPARSTFEALKRRSFPAWFESILASAIVHSEIEKADDNGMDDWPLVKRICSSLESK